jgi:hypothetical protein
MIMTTRMTGHGRGEGKRREIEVSSSEKCKPLPVTPYF